MPLWGGGGGEGPALTPPSLSPGAPATLTLTITYEVATALLVVFLTASGLFLYFLSKLVNQLASIPASATVEQKNATVSFRDDTAKAGGSSNGRGHDSQSLLDPGAGAAVVKPLRRATSGDSISNSQLTLSLSSPPPLPRQRSYRIEEEGKKRSSSEITRRGQLWSRHASWHLPMAPRVVERGAFQIQGIEQVTAILRKYDVDPLRGFLPAQDPLQRLPYARYHIWEDLADDLPKLLGARLGQARDPLQQLPVLSTDKLVIDAELRRAHLLLCLFAHAYVWGGLEPKDCIPEGIAIPLWEISRRLDIPPILSHTSIVLYNWRRLDANGDICMENLSTLNNFFDGRDESWFYLVTVEIEARGAAAIIPMLLSMDAIQRYDEEQASDLDGVVVGSSSSRRSKGRSPSLSLSASLDQHRGSDDLYDTEGEFAAGLSWDAESRDAGDRFVMTGKSMGEEEVDDLALSDALVGELSMERVGYYVAGQLRKVAAAIQGMVDSLATMREGCHPFIFYHRVRPFLSGWKHNPTLPNGLFYQGVTEERQQFYGGSAAQSSLLPFLDLSLGVSHENSKSQDFLLAMRDYMTKPHREFLQYVKTAACIRPFVVACLERHGVGLSEGLTGAAGAGGAASASVASAVATAGGSESEPSAPPATPKPAPVWRELRDAYDACISGLQAFRTGHISLVAEYIMAQQRKDGLKGGIEGTAGGKGTGGTDLMKFLKPIRDDCRDSILSPAASAAAAAAAAAAVPPLQVPEHAADEVDGGSLSTPYLKDNANFEDIDLYRGGSGISSYSAGTVGYKLPVVGW